MYGLKDRYDLVMSVSGSCSGTKLIRKAGMQFASMPLDWAGTYDIQKNANALANGFKDYFVPANLDFVREEAIKQHDVYRDRVTKICFPHDIPYGRKPEDVAGEISRKYERRTALCMERMAKSRSVLLIYTEIVKNTGMTSDEALVAAQQIVQERFPHCEIDVLMFYNVFDRGFDGKAVKEVRPHVFKIGFDISIKGDLDNAYVNHDLIVPILRKLVPGGALDYRTREQKREFARRERMKQFQRLHATGISEYLIHSLYYRLYKHFRKKLERAGFVFSS